MRRSKFIVGGLLSAVGLLGLVAPAQAQEEDTWTGFYVGGNAGVGWGDSSSNPTISTSGTPSNGAPTIPAADVTAINNALAKSSPHHTGFQGGIEAGYNWQSSGGLVIGIETDFGVYDLSGSQTKTYTSPLLINPPLTYTSRASADTDWLWTVRPRIGYATGPVLLYATGGLAMTKVNLARSFTESGTPATTASRTDDQTKTGWTIGAGGAYKISSNVSLKAEYLYLDFGHTIGSVKSADGYLTATSDVGLKGHVIRAGIAYHF